ncbi:hypothetical protein Glove_476g62 [Diversispora epigaea]|uniref:Uncharacterized protein n=1 Tax=Diversispora epigaea TaxID=1348612 RepID=A0A397GU70_9GLOM|nr:hypothetical protein Glove_476g62 [Diversispora epigaea]
MNTWLPQASYPCDVPPCLQYGSAAEVVVFHYWAETLPLILHLLCLFTMSNWSQVQQSLLSLLISQACFLGCGFARW